VGDRSEAFETFFGEHYESVFRGLSVAFRDPLLAEEAAQEAFTRAYTRWERVRGMERPAGWVYVVAVRVARRRRRDLLTEVPAPSPSSDRDLAIEVVDRVTMQAAIEQLPARQRIALVLRYYGGLPLAEIATAMGCALGTVKSTLYTAHERLHVELDDDIDIPEVELDVP
jgi:RNA polymerase sigma-70 factor (ECF subfamily)